MKRKYPGIISVVLAAIVVLSLLAVNVKMDSRPAEAGDQIWSTITMPYNATVAAMNTGAIRSLAVVSATTAFAATSNAVGTTAATSSYIVKTTDGGKTWKPVGNFSDENSNAPDELRSLTVETAGPELEQAEVRLIVRASPNYAVDTTLIVAVSEWLGNTVFDQIYRSKDGGDTFKIMGAENFPAAAAERIKALAISPSYTLASDNTLVVGTLNPSGSPLAGGLYFWQGSGFETWSAVTGAADWYALRYVGSSGLIGVASLDAGAGTDAIYEYRMTVVAGGVVTLPTTSPQRVQIASLVQTATDADQDFPIFDLAFPSNWSAATSSDRNIIAYSNGASTPAGAIYRRQGTTAGHDTLKATAFASIAMQGTSSSGTVFAGAHVASTANIGVSASGDGGATWSDLSVGDRYGIDGVGGIAQVDFAGSTVYVGTAGARGGIFKGANLGATWSDTAAYSQNLNKVETTVTISTTSKFLAIMDTSGNAGDTGLFLTEDGGASWHRVARYGVNSAAGGQITKVSLVGAVGYLTITGTGVISGQIKKSTDGGKTWAATTGDPSDTVAMSSVGLAQDGADRVWAMLANNTIARTTDGGATWTTSTVSPPGVFQAIVKSPDLKNDKTLMGIVAATKQVYMSRDEGATWTEFAGIPPGGVTTDPGRQATFSPDYKTDRIIYVALRGDANNAGGIYYIKDDGTVTTSSSWTRLSPMWNPDGTVVGGVNDVVDIGYAANGSVVSHESTTQNFVRADNIAFSGKTMYVADGGRASISTYDVKGQPIFWRHMSALAPGAITSHSLKTDAAKNVILYTTVSGVDGNVQTFTDSAARPTLLAPADKADGVAQVTALTWASVPNATLYEIAFGLTPSLAGVTTFTSNETGIETARWYGAERLIEGGTYYWAVREKQPIQGPWSEIRSFKVGVVTIRPTPTPAAPAAPAVVTASIAPQLVVVWGFDAATQAWKVYDPAAPAPANTLAVFAEGAGYWLNVNAATTLIYAGKTRTLFKGWNLIGW